jgi:hypothetical protein
MSSTRNHISSSDAVAILERLTQVLTQANLRPGDLDRVFHLTPGYFGKILRGERTLLPRHLAEVALMAGVSEEWLRTGEGPTRGAEAPGPYRAGPPGGWRYCPHCGRELAPPPARDGEEGEALV